MGCELTEPCCSSPGRRKTSDETRETAPVERPLSAWAAYALHIIPIGRCRIFLSDRLLDCDFVEDNPPPNDPPQPDLGADVFDIDGYLKR